MRLMECNRDDETLTQELATTKLLPPLGWAEWIGKVGMDDTRPWRELGAKEERWRSRKLKPFTYHHQNSQETGRELERRKRCLLSSQHPGRMNNVNKMQV